MSKALWKEVRELRKRKEQQRKKENLVEVTKLCNCIGELLSKNELYEEAVTEHEEEVKYSRLGNDAIGVAVGHRKIGECLCELGRFEEALKHQRKHHKISLSVENVLEQQRALATIGRTLFMQAESLQEQQQKMDDCLKQALKAYLDSLDLSNKLYGEISDKEILEMKARLYLNVGLVYEMRQDITNALKYVCKALVISREENLKDNVFRCHYTLSGFYVESDNLEKALQSAKSAVSLAKEQKNKNDEMVSMMQMGQILLRLKEFAPAVETLKKVYKDSTELQLQRTLIKTLKLAIKSVNLSEKYKECKEEEELLLICEGLGDLYSEIKCPKEAAQYYFEQLKYAKSLNLSDKSLADIYTSLAVTLVESQDYEEALKFYDMEIQLRQDDMKENSATYCAAAHVMEKLQVSYETIKEYYMKAVRCAEESGSKLAEIKAYRDWSAYLNASGCYEEHQQVEYKVKTICEELKDRGDDEESETRSEEEEEETAILLSENELLALESDNDTGNNEEEEDVFSHTLGSRKQRKKVTRRNERGETPLHVAAIGGDLEKVKILLQQGASPKERDYCGWQPLHEACNHGYAEIVAAILDYGADVNDPGGQHCGGITPLHDASQNGHVSVVELLISRGASVETKTKEGCTALDLVQLVKRNNEEEFSDSHENKDFIQNLCDVEQCLLKFSDKHKDQVQPIGRRNCDINFEDDNSMTTDDKLPDEADVQHENPRFSSSSEDSCVPDNFYSNCYEDNMSSNSLIDSFHSSQIRTLKDSRASETSRKLPNETRALKASRLSETSRKSPNETHTLTTSKSSLTTRKLPSPLMTKDHPAMTDFIIEDDNKSKRSHRKDSISNNKRNETIPSITTDHEDFIMDDLTNKHLERHVDLNIQDPHKKRPRMRDSELYSVRKKQRCSINVEGPNRTYTNQDLHEKSHSPGLIHVRVDDFQFCITCPSVTTLSTDWLIQETSKMLFDDDSSSCNLILIQQNGELANPSDTILHILNRNEDGLTAKLLDAVESMVLQRYRKLCKKRGIDLLPEVLHQLEHEELQEASLVNMFLTGNDLNTVFHSISYHTKMTSVTLNGTYLGDENVHGVVRGLMTIPSLKILDLSCTGLSTKALKVLAQHVQRDDSAHPKPSLTSLHLSNNNFNNPTVFIWSMCTILRYWTELQQLELQACQLNNSYIKETFQSALKASKIKILNISRNYFGYASDTFQILDMVNHETITSLDLSTFLLEEKYNSGCLLVEISEYCVNASSSLTHVQLDNLHHSHLNYTGNLNPHSRLSSLTLRYNVFPSQDFAESFLNKISRLKCLKKLDMSYCQSFDGRVLDTFIKSLKSNHSPLQMLVARCCELSFLHEASCKMLSLTYLNHIDLSYNELDDDDRKRLLSEWKKCFGRSASWELSGQKFILCKCD